MIPMIPMSVTDATTTVGIVDTGATNPALPVITTPLAPVAPLTPMGARAPERARLATVTAPLGATIPPQDNAWRAHATQMAYDRGMTCVATWLGPSARGAEHYRVPAARRALSHVYRVSFIPNATAQTIDDGRYLCECPDGKRGVACVHVGAAYLLANRRAVVRESVALAAMERMSWAWATPQGIVGDSPAGLTAVYRVARGQGRMWGYLRVFWDRRNHVALWCDCGAPNGCAHVGSVALYAERERREYLTRCQQTWH